MPHTTPLRNDERLAPDPVDRPLAQIGGDIRDRLAVLLNAALLIRLANEDGNPSLQSGLRLIERQVHQLGQLADEICQARDSGNGSDGVASDQNGSELATCSTPPDEE